MVVHATVKVCPAVIVDGGGVVHVAVGMVITGIPVPVKIIEALPALLAIEAFPLKVAADVGLNRTVIVLL